MVTQSTRLLRQGHKAALSDRAAAEQAFESASELAPSDPRGGIQLGLLQARAGECEAARQTVDDLIARFPERPLVRLMASRAMLECGDAETAQPLLTTAALALPDNPLAAQCLALCDLMAGDATTAIERFERAGLTANTGFLSVLALEIERRLAPSGEVTDPEAPPPSESFLHKMGMIEARALRRPPSGFWGRVARKRALKRLVRIGERAYDRGDYSDAMAAFDAATRVRPEESIVWLGAGLCAMRLRQPNRAAAFLSEGRRRQAGDPVIQATLADALARSGRIADALAAYREVEPVGPDDFHAHYGRGACLAILGRRFEALEQFRIAFDRYRLEALEDCLLPSWEEFKRRNAPDPKS